MEKWTEIDFLSHKQPTGSKTPKALKASVSIKIMFHNCVQGSVYFEQKKIIFIL